MLGRMFLEKYQIFQEELVVERLGEVGWGSVSEEKDFE